MASKEEKSYIATNKKFKHFPIKEEVLALLEDSNFKKPTQVQAESLPITLQ